MASHGSKKVIFAALAGNAAIAVTKFTAGLITGSSAMISEAIHSVVDTGNQLLLLLGLRRAAEPPSPSHPFGHGLELYFWAFVVAILIFGLGAGLSLYEGTRKILEPHPIERAEINYIVLGLAMLFEGATWIVAFREFRKVQGERGWFEAFRASKDPTVFTVLFEDTAAMLGLVVALLGIVLAEALAMPLLDGVASVVIGVILATTAAFLAYECQSLLTGESVAPETRRSILGIVNAQPGIRHLNELRTMHFGPNDVLVALSIDFDPELQVRQFAKTVTRIERETKRRHPEVMHIFVEAQSFEAHQHLVKARRLESRRPS